MEKHMARITKKRKAELKEIAQTLFDANLTPFCTEDVVYICETVKRGLGGVAREELTLAEGTIVFEHLQDLEEQKEAAEEDEESLIEDASMNALIVVDCADALTFDIQRAKSYNVDDEGEEASELCFKKWARERGGNDLTDAFLEQCMMEGKVRVGNGFVALMRS
jgi:hypothetical protein